MSVPLFRHAVATLAYRGGKAIRDAPPSFATYRAGSNSRTPVEILAHVNDLLDWMDGFLTGVHKWHVSAPGAWTDEVTRFHSALVRVDQRLEAPLIADLSLERLFQGPVADALHTCGPAHAAAPARGCTRSWRELLPCRHRVGPRRP